MASYTTLRRGSTGDEVKKLQKALGITADGIYGKDTEAAVKKHQKANGLTIDGIAGKNTLGSLYTTKTTKTTKTNKDTPKLKGVDQKTIDTMTSDFKQSDKVSGLEAEKNEIKDKFNDYALDTDIIDQSIYDTLNSKFVVPEAVTQADAYLTSQLEKIQSGRTSWSDDVESMIEQIKNRDKFEYDVDNDQLFQQALASAMNSGKTAMQDTIGQASALTGGYGSTYATSAGNQAYNSFIEDAYNNLPEYYQMALSAYQAEGEDMYRELGMYMDADTTEYGRMVDAYNTTASHRNTLYNEAYSLWRDGKTDAYNIGNLQLSENSQIVSNLYNAYNVSANEYENAYANEFQTWQSEVTNATNLAQLLNSDYWSQTNFDESVRQFDKTFNAEYTSDGKGGYVKKGTGGGGSDYDSLTSAEAEKVVEIFTQAGGGEKGYTAVDNYLSTIGKNNLSEEGSAALKSTLGDTDVPVYYQDWTISTDTYNGGFLGLPFWQGDDHNDVYSNGSTTMTFKQLKKAIENSDLSEEEKKKRIENLRKQSEN